MHTGKGRGLSSRSLVLAGSITVIAVVTIGVVVGAPRGVARSLGSPTPKPTARVLSLETPPPPTPTPAPWVEPTAAPVFAPTALNTSGCPQMNNPGGGVTWIPSDDAGPWPTDGAVSIPALGASAPIVRVGVDANSQMVVPPRADQVSWLDQGGIPGDTNNIVLAGHVTWSGVPGAFHRIEDLLPGDMIVVSINGRQMIFRTVWICEFARTSSLAPRIMGLTDVPSVTLITCSGPFDSGAGTHTDRVVARAELVY